MFNTDDFPGFQTRTKVLAGSRGYHVPRMGNPEDLEFNLEVVIDSYLDSEKLTVRFDGDTETHMVNTKDVMFIKLEIKDVILKEETQ